MYPRRISTLRNEFGIRRSGYGSGFMNQRRYFLNIALGYSGGRDCATVHVSHECVCLSSLEKVVWRHMQSFLSSKGHKKRSCRRGGRPLLCEPSTPAGSWVRKRYSRGEREPFLFYRCLLLQQQSASHLIGRFRAHQIVHYGHAESIDHARLFV